MGGWQPRVAKPMRTYLVCNVQSLSQLITGFLTPDELEFAGRITINDKRNVLADVFRHKKLYINDYF